jgi:hypothetical protein
MLLSRLRPCAWRSTMVFSAVNDSVDRTSKASSAGLRLLRQTSDGDTTEMTSAPKGPVSTCAGSSREPRDRI